MTTLRARRTQQHQWLDALDEEIANRLRTPAAREQRWFYPWSSSSEQPSERAAAAVR